MTANDRLVSAAELSRALGVSRARITQMKSEGMPFVSTPTGDRFHLHAATRFHCRIARPRAPIMDEDEIDAETLVRMEAVVNTALRERLVDLQSDDRVSRFVDLMSACGVAEKERYLAVQCARMWLGTSVSGEAQVVIDQPVPESQYAEWQGAFRSAVGALITSSHAQSTL